MDVVGVDLRDPLLLLESTFLDSLKHMKLIVDGVDPFLF